MNRNPENVETTGTAADKFEKQSVDDLFLVLILWVLGTIVFAQFFSRYVVGRPLGWTEEIARYLLIWLTFLGATTAVKRRSHIVVTFFYRYVPLRACRAVSLCIDLLLAAFSLFLAWQSYALTAITFQAMSSIPVPKSVIYYGTAVFFAIMGVRFAVTGVRSFRGKELCPLAAARITFLEQLEEKKGSREDGA